MVLSRDLLYAAIITFRVYCMGYLVLSFLMSQHLLTGQCMLYIGVSIHVYVFGHYFVIKTQWTRIFLFIFSNHWSHNSPQNFTSNICRYNTQTVSQSSVSLLMSSTVYSIHLWCYYPSLELSSEGFLIVNKQFIFQNMDCIVGLKLDLSLCLWLRLGFNGHRLVSTSTIYWCVDNYYVLSQLNRTLRRLVSTVYRMKINQIVLQSWPFFIMFGGIKTLHKMFQTYISHQVSKEGDLSIHSLFISDLIVSASLISLGLSSLLSMIRYIPQKIRFSSFGDLVMHCSCCICTFMIWSFTASRSVHHMVFAHMTYVMRVCF